MLTVSGVYAEDIDSSVVAESPISADADTSLSSCNAFNNDLSNSFEPSDSLSYYESYDSFESLEYTPQANDDVINYVQSGSYGCVDEYNIAVIDVKYDSPDCELIDVPDDVGYTILNDSNNPHEFFDVPVVNADSYVDCGLLCQPAADGDGIELGSVINVVENDDNNVIINKSNSCSNCFVAILPTIILDKINISAFKYLNQEIDSNIVDTIISEVTFDIETSESYKLIRNVTQVDNLVNFESANAVLAINVSGIPIGEASEPVFDGILRVSEYISKGQEVYLGTLSESDNLKLLRSIGSENTLLFASIAKWYSGVTFDMQQKLADHGQILEDFLDGYTVTKALLQYDSLNNELYVYIINSDENEDEDGHVINDTNSHGLDYAYAKHVKVNNKDMLKLILLGSYGDVLEEDAFAAGSKDGLNDVLGVEMPGETLLPDQKAIWTPLLLLQLVFGESDAASHAGNNENMDKTKCKCGAYQKSEDCNCTDNKCSCHDKSHYKCKHCHHKHWRPVPWYPYHWHPCFYPTAGEVVPELKLDNSTKNSTKNSTNNKTNSTGNATSIKGEKFYDSPKTEVEGNEPTYTLVYAIIGIVIVSILFTSSYMKRDD